MLLCKKSIIIALVILIFSAVIIFFIKGTSPGLREAENNNMSDSSKKENTEHTVNDPLSDFLNDNRTVIKISFKNTYYIGKYNTAPTPVTYDKDYIKNFLSILKSHTFYINEDQEIPQGWTYVIDLYTDGNNYISLSILGGMKFIFSQVSTEITYTVSNEKVYMVDKNMSEELINLFDLLLKTEQK